MGALISIIMTVRNGEKYLRDCLNSIRNQSYSNWELICVNNRSTDTTRTILEEFCSFDQRMKFFDNEEEPTIPSALSQALDKCKGDLVTRMDADDIMYVDKLGELSQAIDDNNSVATSFIEYFPKEDVKDGYRKFEKWINNNMISENPYNEIYKECILPSPNWMMKRQTLLSIGGIPDNVIPEDYDIAFRCYENNLKIKAIPKVLHYWREYDNRNTKVDPDYLDNNYFEIKTKYFLSIDRDQFKPLVVWGAGKKGKEVVRLLLANGESPDWITDNTNKIGNDIYGLIVRSTEYLQSLDEFQLIVCVSGPEDLKAIKSIENGLNQSFYYFV